MWLLALACGGPKAPPAPAAEDAPEDDGPIAGPRSVVEQAPPEALPADTPGGGPLPPYLTALRKTVRAAMTGCEGAATPPTEPTLVVATLEADGTLDALDVQRASGNDAWDQCLAKAFRTAKLPPPPAATLGEGGVLVTPQIAFK